MGVLLGLAAATLGMWVVLLAGRALFWWPAPQLGTGEGENGGTPGVVAVIPARDEADVLPETLPSVLTQEYAGSLYAIVVDDRSGDATATAAREAAIAASEGGRLTILRGTPRPDGWAGKLWALEQGVRHAADSAEGRSTGDARSDYLWFTDADIAHERWVLSALVARAEANRLDLVSVMATLRVDSFWDRLLIPAFVYFFAKLYPFRSVGDPRRRTAGAAGGCVLVRRRALDEAGGLAAICSALIDDCALGKLIKGSGGRIWLGYSRGVRSIRSYGRLADIWRMVARSAYTQLGHSPIALLGTVLGMLLLYALPPVLSIVGAIAAALGGAAVLPSAAVGAGAWALMAASFVPLLRHHGVGPWVAPLLPVAGVLYTAMTLSSAWRHARGRGGAWKGRTY